MNLMEIWVGWKKLEFWNQIGIVFGIVGTIASLAGAKMDFIILSDLLLVCAFFLLVYGNIQQSRKLANAEKNLKTVNTRIDQATKAVYDQKKEEKIKFEMEIATWKDKAANVKEERIKSERLLQSERNKFNVERDELISTCQWLHDELARALEQMTQSGKKFYFTGDEIQRTGYVMSGSIVDDRTTGEKRFGEIEVMLKKHKTS